MKILFLTIGRMESIEAFSLYPDLLRQFRHNGHDVYVVSPYERRLGKQTALDYENGVHLLKVKVGNLTKCNIIEKGISTLRIESQFINAIKTYFSDIKFDLILYSTPPITLAGVVEFVKKCDGAMTYLLLKDIFPQNAVDLGMMQASGLKGLIYKYFRRKEKKLYDLSDRIGCMSKKNAEYIIEKNPDIDSDKVEVCPNCIEVRDVRLCESQRKCMREQYGLPVDKTIFVYGGNLGKPQDISFIIKSLEKCADLADTYFVIAGSGTDRCFVEEYIQNINPIHVKLFGQLPKEEYDKMIACCDVGLIFLDHRFTIPNFPSRILAYMQAGLPVLACTDPNTDVGKVIVDGGFGWWCESNDESAFYEIVEKIDKMQIEKYGECAFTYLKNHYTSEIGYKIIMNDKT